MMTKQANLPIPTEAELELLAVLWSKGSATVREVHEEIGHERALGYTTVLKMFQRMMEKGLVQRTEAGKAHTYRPSVSQQETQSQMLRDLSKRLFAGSSTQLAMHALSMQSPSVQELEEVRKILEERSGKR
ncbi:BlaI/MecI/CopY family transcriptional regulator [Granulicella sp. WH15]|uniref:BlaI/MecI/CopY family transcriptional regulator n=1 Tax=Granulicella sp. WH15 TaxID=2602070 RepID=UPI002103D103|nr:BlaI/MecI/CopY family transcriptional regulator [Granulicella sp. WH15]